MTIFFLDTLGAEILERIRYTMVNIATYKFCMHMYGIVYIIWV